MDDVIHLIDDRWVDRNRLSTFCYRLQQYESREPLTSLITLCPDYPSDNSTISSRDLRSILHLQSSSSSSPSPHPLSYSIHSSISQVTFTSCGSSTAIQWWHSIRLEIEVVFRPPLSRALVPSWLRSIHLHLLILPLPSRLL